MDKDIGKIKKGEYQGTVTDIVVGIKEYNGKTGLDIREFTTSEAYTGPTKKGLRIPAESFPAFKEMINSISNEDMQSAPKQEIPSENTASENLPAEQETLEGINPDY